MRAGVLVLSLVAASEVLAPPPCVGAVAQEPTRTAAEDETPLAPAQRALAAGRPEEALAAYDALLQRTPDRLDVRAYRAAALFALGNDTAAREEVRTIRRRMRDRLESELRARPDDMDLLARLARVRSELGEHDAALAGARRLTELQPESAEAHFALGNALARAGQAGAALDSYDRALSLDPRKTEAYAARAAVRERQGDQAGSAADLAHVRRGSCRRSGRAAIDR